MSHEKEALLEFWCAQNAFIEAAGRLSQAWEKVSGDLTATHYPSRLPSFDEFYHELITWQEDSKPEIEQAIADAAAAVKAENQAELDSYYNRHMR